MCLLHVIKKLKASFNTEGTHPANSRQIKQDYCLGVGGKVASVHALLSLVRTLHSPGVQFLLNSGPRVFFVPIFVFLIH